MKTRAGCLLSAWLLLGGCSNKQEPPRRTEPWLATPSAAHSAPTAAGPVLYRFTSDSRITFVLPGKTAQPRGRVPLLGGEVRLDPADLVHSTARLDADLSALTLQPDSLPTDALGNDGSADTAARRWFELGTDVAADRVRSFGRARFELLSVEALSETAQARSEAGKGQREWRATVGGTLLVHGFRAPVRAEVGFVLSPVAGDLTPTLTIRTKRPFSVVLATYEITARDPAGTPLPLEAKAWLERVGKAAQVEFELVAKSEPAAASR